MFRRKKNQDTIATRVQRGMQTLDKAKPGWHRRISLMDLNIAQSNNCALGQIYGSYGDGRYALGMSAQQAKEQGFQAHYRFPLLADAQVDAEFAALTAEWQRQILARQRETVIVTRPRRKVLTRR